MKKLLLSALVLFTVSSFAQTWVSKSNIPGQARRNISGFALNNKGYVCLGGDGTTTTAGHFNDLYEYDPINDSWTAKASFPAAARRNGIAFTVDSLAYVGMGWDNSTTYYDIYTYNPNSDTWAAATVYPGSAGRETFAVTAGNKVYVGGGIVGTPYFYSDFWEYDPVANSWTQKSSFPFNARAAGVALSMNGKVYMGMGANATAAFGDFWEYDPQSDTWTQMADFPGGSRVSPVAFKLNGKFIVGGGTGIVSSNAYDDYYAYDPPTDTWTSLGNFPLAEISRAAYFTINGKGYAVAGYKNASNQQSTLEFSGFSTSIDELFTPKTATLSIYPNPSQSMINLKVEAKEWRNAEVRIYDTQGKLLHKEPYQTNAISVEQLESGLYFVELFTEAAQLSGRFIKQ